MTYELTAMDFNSGSVALALETLCLFKRQKIANVLLLN